jgi:arabinogalactan oligomer / maltooligosaccharide transport system permease protein
MAIKEKPLKRAIIHLILILSCVAAIYPILNVISISLRPGDRAFSTSLAIIPKDATLDAFRIVLIEKGYRGGDAAIEEGILTEIRNGDREELKQRQKNLFDEKKENGEKTLGRERKVSKIFDKSINMPDDLIDKRISYLKEMQTKTWYKFFNAAFWTWLKNSMIVSFFTVFFGVIFSLTAGYAFSRYNFVGKKFGMTFFLVTQMFPPVMLLLPMYLVMSKISFTDIEWLMAIFEWLRLEPQSFEIFTKLVTIYITTALPVCVWQMKGYYDTIPYTLEEAALIDGCSPFQAFYQIILPLVKPGIVVTALFSFMAAWTDFAIANVMLQREEYKTLSLGLQSMNGRYMVEWANFSAASILVMIPALLLFMYLSRFLVSGLTLGGVKE